MAPVQSHLFQSLHERAFACTRCGLVITRKLRLLPESMPLDHAAGHDLLPPGNYFVSPGEFEPEKAGDYLVNLKDLQNCKHHSDLRRRNGCCGLDGFDGFNLVCDHGHEIGTERSDCWHGHHAVLSCSRVKAA